MRTLLRMPAIITAILLLGGTAWICSDALGNMDVNGSAVASVSLTNAPTRFNAIWDFNRSTYYDDVRYATVQAAINAACNGTIPGQAVIAPGTYQMSIAIPSNCVVSGAGRGKTTLQSNISQSTPILLVSGVTNVIVRDLSLDANRSTNSNVFDAARIANSTNIELERIRIHDANGNGLEVSGASLRVTVQDSEIFRNGPPLLAGQAAGIFINPGGSSMSNVSLLNNDIHDNNLGVQTFNPSVSSATLTDYLVSGNRFHANASDGFSIFTSAYTFGGLIRGPQIENNTSSCNGWPSNGTGFSVACAAGFLQNGSTASPSGVGIDVIGFLVSYAVISGNYAHDNVFDGISVDGGAYGSVSTSGTEVKSSSPLFNVNWRPNETVKIGGTIYKVASVHKSTEMILARSAGTQAKAAFYGPGLTFDVITGNRSDFNGTGSIGTGFYNSAADGNVFSDNVARSNNLQGLACVQSAFVSYSGDKAISNGRNSILANQGFAAVGCLSPSYIGISTDDPNGPPTQVYGVYLDPTTSNAAIWTPSLRGSGGGSALNDLTTTHDTFYSN